MQKQLRNLLATVALASAGAYAHAAPAFDEQAAAYGSSTQTPAAALQKLRTKASPALKARSCGLVLLSHGRALAAQAKGMGAVSDPTETAGHSMAWLVSAFLMLRDGRDAAGPESRQVHASLSPDWTPTPEAMKYCTELFETRRKSANFDVSEEAKWEAAASAKATFDTEQPR